MDIEVSVKTKKILRQFKLTAQHLAFADLVAVGWEPEDAWAVAVREGLTWNKKARRDAIENVLNNEYVQERINSVRQVLRKNQQDAIKAASAKEQRGIIEEAMSKEAMLISLQTALEGKLAGSKEWIDIKKMIIDVTRMKQDEVKDEERTIHYFLPVHYPTGCKDCLYSKCDSCKYKKAYKEPEDV